MKSLQRLQQQILATDVRFGTGISLTPRANRLRTGLKRSAVIGATAAGLLSAGAYVRVGPGSYDPHKLYMGDPQDSRVMASIYDHHRALLAAQERTLEITRDMIEGTGPSTLAEQATQLRVARAEEQKLKGEFVLQTKGLTQEQIREIVGEEQAAAAANIEKQGARASRPKS
jgi:hypothetical protein